MRPLIPILAVFLAAPLTSLIAQEPPPLRPGQRVRVFVGATNTTLLGTVMRFHSDSLTVRTDRRRMVIPIASVLRLEVSRGRSNAPRILGGVIGAVAGGVIGGAVAEECPPGWDFECTFQKPIAVLIGASFGAVAGALVGILVRPERWEEVPLDQLRVTPVAAVGPAGRFGLGLSVRF